MLRDASRRDLPVAPRLAPAAPKQGPAGHHLKLVQYLPAGGQAHVCAAIWRAGEHVHLTSPLLRRRHGVRDPRSYVRQFPEGIGSIDAFEDTMGWLDAACYAASDPREIAAACQQHPEWQLRCIRYDGGDAALLGLAGLIRATENVDPLPAPVLRECLLELIRQILRSDPALELAQIETTCQEGDDVATLEVGSERAVLVTLLPDVVSTDAVRQGQLAHQRMTDQFKGWVQCLLVAPSLQIERPMFLTARVAITDMDADHLRAALVQLATG
ncbi:MAG: hypothetical protein Q8M01_02600 [Rubrivivax sp.]|nr:hypothetical protein [Rubrivivax sp.]